MPEDHSLTAMDDKHEVHTYVTEMVIFQVTSLL